MSLLNGVLSGLVVGVGYGIAGYKCSGEENFRWKDFLGDVIPSMLIGGFAGYQGIPFEIVSSGAVGLGATKFIKKAIRLLWQEKHHLGL